MKRRNALKAIGVLLLCVGGRAEVEAKMSEANLSSWEDQPINYIFEEGSIKNLIIERKNGKDLIIPFSEIVEALLDKEN